MKQIKIWSLLLSLAVLTGFLAFRAIATPHSDEPVFSPLNTNPSESVPMQPNLTVSTAPNFFFFQNNDHPEQTVPAKSDPKTTDGSLVLSGIIALLLISGSAGVLILKKYNI